MTNKTSKPCREWLETLASPYREQALANWELECGLCKFNNAATLSIAIVQSFCWNDTPEGYDYWIKIHQNPSDYVNCTI